MRLLIKLLLGLALLSPIVEAGYWYRVIAQFLCDGKPSIVKFKIIEHDPDSNGVREVWSSTIDEIGSFEDDPYDFLELSIHAGFICGYCEGELYQYIPMINQHTLEEVADESPVNLGSVELSDVCKFGTAKSRYSRYDRYMRRKQWFVRDAETNIRDHFTEIN